MADNVLIKADNNNPPTTVIEHASITTDIASDLAGKRYATAEPPVTVELPEVEGATAPTVGEAGESSVTLNIDTRTVKKYFEKDDILPIWYAAGFEVKVKKSKLEGEVEESTETIVKDSATTNTVSWRPDSVGVYDLTQTGDLAGQIIYTTPVDLTTNGLEVAGTKVEVTADGAAIPEDGRIATNSTVTVTLPDGTTASEMHECKNGKHETEFNAREHFGEVQIPKGVKVTATLVPMTGPRHG